MVVVALLILAAALPDGHTHTLFENKTFITYASRHARLIRVAVWWSAQVLAGRVAGGYTVSVVAVHWAGRL